MHSSVETVKSVFFAFAPAVYLPASSESGDSESDEDCADDRIDFHMVMSIRAGRERVFTSRMRDFLQSR